MKTIAISCLLASTAAFAPAPLLSSKTTTVLHADLSTMPGVSIETGGKVFDPLELAQWRDIEQLRASELANGRAAMLAVVGWVFPQVVGTFPSGPVTTTDPIGAIAQVPTAAWAQIVGLMGLFEAAQFNWNNNIDAPGVFETSTDVFFDPAKVYPKGAAGQEEMQLKELKNGRMAMIAFAGLLTHHFMPDAVPLLGGLK